MQEHRNLEVLKRIGENWRSATDPEDDRTAMETIAKAFFHVFTHDVQTLDQVSRDAGFESFARAAYTADAYVYSLLLETRFTDYDVAPRRTSVQRMMANIMEDLVAGDVVDWCYEACVRLALPPNIPDKVSMTGEQKTQNSCLTARYAYLLGDAFPTKAATIAEQMATLRAALTAGKGMDALHFEGLPVPGLVMLVAYGLRRNSPEFVVAEWECDNAADSVGENWMDAVIQTENQHISEDKPRVVIRRGRIFLHFRSHWLLCDSAATAIYHCQELAPYADM